MFGDYFYNAANGGLKSEEGFQFRRIYFTYDNDISEKFFTRFRLEADQPAQTKISKIGVFVKDAYLQW